MSPVNSDDHDGEAFGADNRPLTRKEIRAQEKYEGTPGHDVIPPQAFETGGDIPTAAPGAGHGYVPGADAADDAAGDADDAVQTPPIHAAAAPDRPAAAPTVHH